MKSLHVKKGDRVKVIGGVKKAERGTVSEILAVDVERQRVTVEGVNLVKRHRKDSVNASGQQVKGGIITFEAPIHVSNVQLVTKVGGKDVVSRVGYKREEVTKTRPDGSEYTTTRSVRFLKKDEADEKPAPKKAAAKKSDEAKPAAKKAAAKKADETAEKEADK